MLILRPGGTKGGMEWRAGVKRLMTVLIVGMEEYEIVSF
jgi:hypothetical protein